MFEEKSNKKLLAFAALSTIFGNAIPIGHNLAVINSPANVIKKFISNIIYSRYGTQLSKNQLNILWASIVSIFLIGGWIGSLLGSKFGDKFGRKKALMLGDVISFLSAIIFVSSKLFDSVELLMLARLTVGISAGIGQNTMPIYLTELAPPHWRGSIAVCTPLGVSTGLVIAEILSLDYILGSANNWIYAITFYVIPVTIGFFILLFLPESPQFVKMNNRKKINEVDAKQESWSVMKVIFNKEFRLAIALVASLNIVHQFCGFHAVLFYSTSIFKKTGLSSSVSELATIGVGTSCLINAILNIYTMAKYNRRFINNLSLLTTAIFLIILGISIQLESYASWMPYLSIIGVIGMVFSFGIGLAPIPYFLASELFETGPRSSATALGNLLYWSTSFIVGQGFPIIEPFIGGYAFFIFASFVIAELIFTWFFLPETRNRRVSELVKVCNMGFTTKVRNYNV